MTAATLEAPEDIAPLPQRTAGGDNEVERDSKGRPRIVVFCAECENGRVPSEKRPGNTVQCKKCSGDGKYTRSFTRTTTFIDVLDDKTNLDAWNMRMVLIGVAKDTRFLEGISLMDPEDKEDKDELNRRAQAAKLVAGAEDKADKGTFLHGLSELVDMGHDLPDGISFGDVIDMDSYRSNTRWRKIVHLEQLVVNDQYHVAGTPDRVSEIRVEEFRKEFPRMFEEYGGLVAPDGSIVLPGQRLITDLKTGSVEYGALKMAMQLAMYSRSKLYNKETGQRTPLRKINRKWGLIDHLPAGKGNHTLYWADLTLGWRAVRLAYDVREIRRLGKRGLLSFDPSV